MPKKSSSPAASLPRPEQTTVPLDRVDLSPLNPRTEFPKAGIRDLAATVERDGLLQPLTVRPAPGRPGHFEIAAGERRFRALRQLHEEGKIPADWPVPVQIRELDDRELLTLALVENLLREDLHPLDEAYAYERLVEAGARTAEIAQRVRRTQRHVQFRLKMTGLAPEVQRAFRAGEVNVRQARALATVPAEQHLPAFEALQKWPSVYQDASNLMGLLTKDTFPRDRAAFAPREYTGPTVRDPETGKVYYADVPQALRLQKTAAERLREELLGEKGYREVEILEGGTSQVWARFQSAEGEGTHAVVLLSSGGELSVFESLRPLGAARGASPAAGTPAAADEPAAAGGAPDEDEGPTPRTLLAAAQRLRNSALQEAVAGRPEIALRLILVGLLQPPGSYRAGLALAPSKPAPPAAAGSPTAAAARAALAKTLGGEIVPEPTEGEPLLEDLASPERSARLFEALLALADKEVLRLLAPVAAARVGSPALESSDTPLARRLAGALGASVAPDAWLHRGYLELYRRAHLIRLAVDSKAVSRRKAAALGDLTKDEIIERILGSSTRDPAFLPPELRFHES